MSRFDPHADCYAFHVKYGLGKAAAPQIPPPNVIEHRKAMINEECDELIEAIEKGDLVQIAREGIDLVMVVIGTFIVYGLPFKNIWIAVHAANMRKLRSKGDTAASKPIKPPGWRSPDDDVKREIYGKNPISRLQQAKVVEQEAESSAE